MANINQKNIKFIISFVFLFFVASCDTTTNYSDFGQSKTEREVKIALMLPMSGPESSLAKEYAKMVKIGLSDSAKTKIKITTYDSANSQTLNNSIEKILNSGTDIIIGPIYSSVTKNVAHRIKKSGIILISFSNNPAIAGRNQFVFGHAPMRQLEHLTDHFLQNNYKNYITLLPSGRYSSLTNQVLGNIISSNGGKLVKSEFYSSSYEDIEKSVKSVSDQVDLLNEDHYNQTQPVVIIADDSLTLQTLYNLAKKYNLDKKSIIAGDNRSNIDSDINIDIVFTGTEIPDRLMDRFHKAGVRHVSSMHAIAYDSGRMVGSKIGHNYNRKIFLENMNSPESFSGISGNINFVDYIAIRKYDLIKKDSPSVEDTVGYME